MLKWLQTTCWICSTVNSTFWFFTILPKISFTTSTVRSLWLNVAWASKEIIAPSNSRTLLLTYLQIYSNTSSEKSIPSLCALKRAISIRVSKSGAFISADNPQRKRESKRSSKPLNSAGERSDVKINCFPDWCKWLNIWKNVFCVAVFPANSWISSRINTSINW